MNNAVEIVKVVQQNQTEKRLLHLAQNDNLTNLPNRHLFFERLQSAVSANRTTPSQLALMYIDVDHFKTINDTEGHGIGDTLLKAFAARLKASIRNTDTVARIGGDEFVVILQNLKKPAELHTVIQHILKNVRGEYKLGDKVLTITASMGATFFAGGETTVEEFIQQADEALYQVKKAGRNGYKIAGSQD